MSTMFSEIALFAESELSAIVPSGISDFEVYGVSTLQNLAPNHLAFAKLVEPEFLARIETVKDVAVIVPLDAPGAKLPFLRVENPRRAFAKLAEHFFVPRYEPGIHPSAVIDESADIDSSASVGPFCVIGPNCKIGARTALKSHVTLSRNVIIGDDCVIWSHAVIGDDGFGIERSQQGVQKRLPHFGGVVLGNGVHIGNMAAIVSGTIEPTTIGDGTMVDNLVHIAHNCRIGQNCQIIACAEVSGSVIIDDNVTLGPNSSVIQKISIGANSISGVGTVIIKSVPENVVVAGVPGRVLRQIPDEGTST